MAMKEYYKAEIMELFSHEKFIRLLLHKRGLFIIVGEEF